MMYSHAFELAYNWLGATATPSQLHELGKRLIECCYQYSVQEYRNVQDQIKDDEDRRTICPRNEGTEAHPACIEAGIEGV